jgi:hypothetical protein
MVCHQTKTVYPVSKALYTLLDEKIEPVPVRIVEEYILPGVASENNMITCASIM